MINELTVSPLSVKRILYICWFLLVGLNAQRLFVLVHYNQDSLVLLKEAESANTRYTPRLQHIAQDLESRQQQLPCQAGGLLAMLSIWAGEPKEAAHWLQTYPCVAERFLVPDLDWKTFSRFFFLRSGWTNSRQVVTYSTWVTAINSLGQAEESAIIKMFQRGLVLAQGRVPHEVRILYYKTLSDWYTSKSDNSEGRRLAQKFSCLVSTSLDCFDAQSSTQQGVGELNWRQPLASNDLNSAAQGWRLVGLELDTDVLAAGVEVYGLLLWEKIVDDRIEQKRQVFRAPNLVPNPSFEFDELFVGACIDGYASSHLYVSPCVSYVVHDPYDQRSGHVAVTETREKGFALFMPSFEVKSGHDYVTGGWFCADGGGVAAVGVEWLEPSSFSATKEFQFWQWMDWEETHSDDSDCWSSRVKIVHIPDGIEEMRLRFDRRGGLGEPLGRVMFDDMFFFEIPAFDEVGTGN